MRYFILICFGLILDSCHVDKSDYQGTYESESGYQFTINCDNQFEYREIPQNRNFPESGEQIEVIVNEETYDICYKINGIYTSFGKWIPDKRAFIFQGIIFNLKEKTTCE